MPTVLIHSVLLPQTIHWLCPTVDGTTQRKYVDCTVGGAGHSTAILENHPLNQLLCIDRDTIAIQVAQERLSDYGDRVQIRRGAFADVLQTIEPNQCDGILMDLGVSSPQLNIGNEDFLSKGWSVGHAHGSRRIGTCIPMAKHH